MSFLTPLLDHLYSIADVDYEQLLAVGAASGPLTYQGGQRPTTLTAKTVGEARHLYLGLA